MRKLIHVLVLLLPLLLIAQDKSVIVDLSQFDDIRQIETTPNYTGILNVDKNQSYQYSVLLYDNSGDQIFKREERRNNNVLRIFIIEELDIFLIISEPSYLYNEYGENKDLLQAFDIATGLLKWERVSNAPIYKISPDNLKIMTAHHNEGEDRSEFAIYYLENGEDIQLDETISEFDACWINNTEVGIFTQEYETNPSYQRYQSIDRRKESEKIVQRYFEAKRNFKHGKISRDQLKISENQMKKDLKDLENKLKENRKLVENINQYMPPQLPKTCRVRILSLVDKRFVEDKYIYDESGDRIVIGSLTGSQGNLHTDSEGNIYIISTQKVVNSTIKDITSIYKFNNEFKNDWCVQTPTMAVPNILYKNGEIYFVNIYNELLQVLDKNGVFRQINSNNPEYSFFEVGNTLLRTTVSLSMVETKQFENQKILNAK